MEEMYGPGIDTETRRTLGAYGSRNGVFALAAENMRSTSDARESIRHEVLGHYGLDTFAPDDLRTTKGFYLPLGRNTAPGSADVRELQKRIQGIAGFAARNITSAADTRATFQREACHPRARAAVFGASNLDSQKDIRETFRHEILGHFGLNTFAPENKKALLERIKGTRKVESIKPFWDEVDRS